VGGAIQAMRNIRRVGLIANNKMLRKKVKFTQSGAELFARTIVTRRPSTDLQAPDALSLRQESKGSQGLRVAGLTAFRAVDAAKSLP
jgi:hypothetical protein